MSTDNKTLADVQPGGKVRLGDQAERARFEAWASEHNYSVAMDGEQYEFAAARLMWKAWRAAFASGAAAAVTGTVLVNMGDSEAEFIRANYEEAALSAQPSPGGQGDARMPFEAWAKGGGFDVSKFKGIYNSLETRAAWEAWLYWQRLAARQSVGNQHPDDLAVDAFAAAMKAKMAAARAKGRGGWEDAAQCTADDLSRMLRDHVEKGDPRDVANFCMMLHQRGEAIAPRQPMGEPVAWMTHHDDPMLFPTAAEAAAYCEDDEQPVPLFRSPAQAVDLGQFRQAVCAMGLCAEEPEDVEEAKRLLALIDSQAVAMADVHYRLLSNRRISNCMSYCSSAQGAVRNIRLGAAGRDLSYPVQGSQPSFLLCPTFLILRSTKLGRRYALQHILERPHVSQNTGDTSAQISWQPLQKLKSTFDSRRLDCSKVIRPYISKSPRLHEFIFSALLLQRYRERCYGRKDRGQFRRYVGKNNDPFSLALLGDCRRYRLAFDPDLFRTTLSESVGLLTKFPYSDAGHDSSKHSPKSDNQRGRCKHDRNQCNSDGPAVPPYYAVADAWLHARTDSVPKPVQTAHSLIPLWTRRHSAMAWLGESCYG